MKFFRILFAASVLIGCSNAMFLENQGENQGENKGNYAKAITWVFYKGGSQKIESYIEERLQKKNPNITILFDDFTPIDLNRDFPAISGEKYCKLQLNQVSFNFIDLKKLLQYKKDELSALEVNAGHIDEDTNELSNIDLFPEELEKILNDINIESNQISIQESKSKKDSIQQFLQVLENKKSILCARERINMNLQSFLSYFNNLRSTGQSIPEQCILKEAFFIYQNLQDSGSNPLNQSLGEYIKNSKNKKPNPLNQSLDEYIRYQQEKIIRKTKKPKIKKNNPKTGHLINQQMFMKNDHNQF